MFKTQGKKLSHIPSKLQTYKADEDGELPFPPRNWQEIKESIVKRINLPSENGNENIPKELTEVNNKVVLPSKNYKEHVERRHEFAKYGFDFISKELEERFAFSDIETARCLKLSYCSG